MEYRNLGSCGLKVSALSLGGWLTFGERIDQATTNAIVRCAIDAGVNLLDVADSYGLGKAELALGEALASGGYKRSTLVLSTKVFWPMSPDPNDRGLSRKHIMEAAERSLRNLRTDYLDLYFCHRQDDSTPLEETVRAMDDLIRQGKVLYWGTSTWNQRALDRAHGTAWQFNLRRPIVEQPPYSLLQRDIERWLMPTTVRHNMGLIVWSPLAGGLLTGKYLSGIPDDSRARASTKFLNEGDVHKSAAQVRRLVELAKPLNCTPAQLAIAWLLRRPYVSSVILGATSVAQMEENLKAAAVQIPDSVMTDLNRTFPPPRLKPGDLARLAPLLARPKDLRRLLS